MNENNPFVSTIMIFLNAEEFISEAIESVTAQTYSHWELLLVDDGSTDRSTQIAREFARKFPDRIRYLEHESHGNKGMSASRNLGILYAKGQYVAFLDADDVWFPNTLETQIAIIEAHSEAGMVYGTTEYWYSWTGKRDDLSRDHLDFRGSRQLLLNQLFEPPDLLVRYLEDGRTVPCMCSVLVRHDLLERIGGFSESFRGLYEDQVFYAKVAVNACIYVHDTCCGRYRQHPNSSCAIAAQKNTVSDTRATFLNWLSSYLIERNVVDERVRQALRKQLRDRHHPYLSQLLRIIGYSRGKLKKNR